MTALALRDDQSDWDKNQIDVLHALGVGQDVSAGELAAFLHECQRRKLDPFIRQIYLIGRWDKQQKRKVYRSQTSIDGFRLIARRAADKAGIDYGYEGTIWFDTKGERHEVWLPEKPPAGCKVVVVRNECRYDAVALFAEYVQTNNDGEAVGMWRSMPANQLAKCAEALALRKAFPEDLGGLYTEEEMAQADNTAPLRATAEVIREEPQAPPPGSEEWVSAAQARAAVLPDKAAAAKMWAEIADKIASGAITKHQADVLADLVRARVADLAADSEAEVVEGVIVGLPAEDPWHDKVASITSAEDAAAARADVKTQVRNKTITNKRADEITAAIDARAASLQAVAA